MRRLTLFLSTLCLVLAACSSSSDNAAANPGGGLDGEATVSGNAVKGPLDGKIDASRFDGSGPGTPLGSGTTTGGRFDNVIVRLPRGERVPVVVGASGGFTDEATGLEATVPDDRPLCAVVFLRDGDSVADVEINVLSHWAYESWTSFRVLQSSMDDETSYEYVCRVVEAQFGVGPRVRPDIAGAQPNRILALLTFAVSRLAEKLDMDTELLVSLFGRDFMDGTLDGNSFGTQLTFLPRSGGAALPLPADVVARLRACVEEIPTNPNAPGGGVTAGDPALVALLAARGMTETSVLFGPIVQATSRPVFDNVGNRVGDATARVQFGNTGVGSVGLQLVDASDPTFVDLAGEGPDFTFSPVPLDEEKDAFFRGNTALSALDRFRLFGSSRVGVGCQGGIRPGEVIPRQALVAGGTRIEVRGGSFDPNGETTVTVGGKPATDVKVKSESSLYATTPACPPGATVVEVNGVQVGGLDIVDASDPLAINGQINVVQMILENGGFQALVGQLTGTGTKAAGSANLWVFGAAATDIELDLIVTDNETALFTTSDPLGAARSITDTGAFATADPDAGAFGAFGSAGAGSSVQSQAASRTGLFFTAPASRTMPELGSNYVVLGTFNSEEGASNIWGNVRVDVARRRFGIAAHLTPADGGAPRFVCLSLAYVLGQDGQLSFPDIDPATGVEFARGFMTADGKLGAVVLGTTQGMYFCLLGQRPTEVVDLSHTSYAGAELVAGGAGAPSSMRSSFCVDHRPLARRLLRYDQALGGSEKLSTQEYYVNGSGVVTDPDGNKCGFVTSCGTVLTIGALPYLGGPRVGPARLGMFFPQRTELGLNVDYQFLGQAMELNSETPAQNTFFRHTNVTGAAFGGPLGVDDIGGGKPFALARRLSFLESRRKEILRDFGNQVTITESGEKFSEISEGFALASIGARRFAFECPLPVGGTGCFIIGTPAADGRYLRLRGTAGLTTAWIGGAVPEALAAPNLTGNWRAHYNGVQIDETSGLLFGIVGRGDWSFTQTESGEGTFSRTTSQFSSDELGNVFDDGTVQSGPFPGSYSLGPDGGFFSTTDFGNDFTADHLGIGNNDIVMFMGTGTFPLNAMFVLVRDTGRSPVGARSFCGLGLDFLGDGLLEVSLRYGGLRIETGEAEVVTHEHTRRNIPSFGFLEEAAKDLFPELSGGLGYSLIAASGTDLFGSANQGAGAQNQTGTSAPASNLDLTGGAR